MNLRKILNFQPASMNKKSTSRPTLINLVFFTAAFVLLTGNCLAITDPEKLFITAPTLSVGTFPDHVAVADFNGDQIDDIAVSDRAGGVNILLAKGRGKFQPPVFYFAGQICQGVVAVDFNGDHKPDLLLADQQVTGAIDILLGNG